MKAGVLVTRILKTARNEKEMVVHALRVDLDPIPAEN